MSRAGRLTAGAVEGYRRFLSPLKPRCCRFTPTCSEYAKEAFLAYGFWRGGWLTLRRLLKCHPFYRGSLYDPLPPRQPAGKNRS